MNALEAYRIGDATVIKISEMLLTGFTPRALLPRIEAEVLTKCPEWATSGSVDPVNWNVILSVHTWLAKSPNLTILIDTGIGNDKNRPTIEIMVAVGNIASERVAVKVGALREGLLRNRLTQGGEVRDAYMFSLVPNPDKPN